MSTDLKTNMKHHIATEFYGGIERGRCIQITSRNQNGWIQLTGSEAMDLVDTLLEFVADVMEGKTKDKPSLQLFVDRLKAQEAITDKFAAEIERLQESCRRREDRATEASHQASVLANVCADQKREIERLRMEYAEYREVSANESDAREAKIERLREERDTLARMVNRVAELEAALKEDK
jgi:hypothetical protein